MLAPRRSDRSGGGSQYLWRSFIALRASAQQQHARLKQTRIVGLPDLGLRPGALIAQQRHVRLRTGPSNRTDAAGNRLSAEASCWRPGPINLAGGPRPAAWKGVLRDVRRGLRGSAAHGRPLRRLGSLRRTSRASRSSTSGTCQSCSLAPARRFLVNRERSCCTAIAGLRWTRNRERHS